MPFFYIWLGGAIAFFLFIVTSAVYKERGLWETDLSETAGLLSTLFGSLIWPVVFLGLLISRDRL